MLPGLPVLPEIVVEVPQCNQGGAFSISVMEGQGNLKGLLRGLPELRVFPVKGVDLALRAQAIELKLLPHRKVSDLTDHRPGPFRVRQRLTPPAEKGVDLGPGTEDTGLALGVVMHLLSHGGIIAQNRGWGMMVVLSHQDVQHLFVVVQELPRRAVMLGLLVLGL